MAAKTQQTGDAAILYDDALLDHADAALFEPPASAASVAGGRGSAWMLERGGEQWVLRHYRRGGLPGRFIHDLYFWTGLGSSRAWREWHLTDSLYKEGLPVPQPVAARVQRAGPLLYRCDLITRRIPGTASLAQRLADPASIPWEEAGRTLRRFHGEGLRHADLNAHNILLDDAGRVWLIDFDRGELITPAAAWQWANLSRLHRSLVKLAGGDAAVAAGWSRFLDAYGRAG
jgi:3-deoxy-D-manno-octulosonic acid kinase